MPGTVFYHVYDTVVYKCGFKKTV